MTTQDNNEAASARNEALSEICESGWQTHLAHVARQRQESAPAHETIVREGTGLVCTACGTTGATPSAAVAEGVDTALPGPAFTHESIHTRQKSFYYSADQMREHGAQQREAGRLEGISIGRGQAVRDYVNLNDAALAVDRARQPVSEGLTPDPMLKWALRELLTTLPQRRDWLNPDAEKVLRAALAAAPPAKAEGLSDERIDAATEAIFKESGYTISSERVRAILAQQAKGATK